MDGRYETYSSADLGRCEHEGKVMTRLAVGLELSFWWLIR